MTRNEMRDYARDRAMTETLRVGKWTLIWIAACLLWALGGVLLFGQEEQRKSDRQLIYDLELRVQALEMENMVKHGRPDRPLYKPRGGDLPSKE